MSSTHPIPPKPHKATRGWMGPKPWNNISISLKISSLPEKHLFLLDGTFHKSLDIKAAPGGAFQFQLFSICCHTIM